MQEFNYDRVHTPAAQEAARQEIAAKVAAWEAENGPVETLPIRTGDKVSVTPFSMPDVSVQGRVTEINPWVNENGMVNIKASISYHNRLVEGMNVRVSAFRTAGKQWVVPKSAVVLRTGKQVVFTIVDGRAIWNYVDTGLENATQYTITGETLKDGDQIITTGNINLAHESPIKVIEREKVEN